jgi:tetratricopeptide (TPR) repeat protein
MFPRFMSRYGAALSSRSLPVFLVAASWAYRARADEVVLVPDTTVKQAIGGRVRGQVVSESPSEVVVKLGASTTTVPADEIVSIRYDGQPATAELAETQETAGQLAEAAELFKKAAGEAAGKPFVVQALLYREAAALTELALVEPDRVKEAKDRLARFVHNCPASRQIVAAREDLARLQTHIGDFAGAQATLAALARLPRAGGRAAVLRAKVLAKQGNHSQAVSELDRLIAAFPDRSARQREARLAKAESLVGMKQFKEAEALLHQVIQASPPEDVPTQAAAYNLLGDCFRAANRPKDALLAYLHTDLLYGKDKEEHPRALFQIARLFRQLKQDARADEYAQRLRQEYPRSPWLNAKSTKR